MVVSHISDHYLVYAALKINLPKPPVNFIKARSYKNYGSHRFVSDFE